MKQRVAMLICLIAVVAGMAILPAGITARGQPTPTSEYTLARRASEGPPNSMQGQPKYLGASTCAGPACHGRPEPTDKKRSQQTEFATWSTKDKHHEAFTVLANEQSLQIAKHLKMEKAPAESDRCLNCHSMNVLDPARRGQDFKLADGVSCDGCHGPAEQWLGTHLNDLYEKSLEKGMKDIRNPVVRAEMCLSCHLGNRAEGKTVDHEMYAAGHPALVFEVSAFSQKLPAHWREKEHNDAKQPHAQIWAAGQLVSWRESLRLLSEDMKSDRWPEYAHFDCAACHHDLKDDDWRKRAPFRPQPEFSLAVVAPGRPIWQPSQLGFLTWMGAWALLGDNTTPELIRRVPVLSRVLFAKPFGDRTNAAGLVAEATEEFGQLVEKAKTSNKDVPADETRKYAALVCKMGDVIAWRGPATAQQLAWTIRALLANALPAESEVHAKISRVVDDLADPKKTYDPQDFIEQIRAIREQLPEQ